MPKHIDFTSITLAQLCDQHLFPQQAASTLKHVLDEISRRLSQDENGEQAKSLDSQTLNRLMPQIFRGEPEIIETALQILNTALQHNQQTAQCFESILQSVDRLHHLIKLSKGENISNRACVLLANLVEASETIKDKVSTTGPYLALTGVLFSNDTDDVVITAARSLIKHIIPSEDEADHLIVNATQINRLLELIHNEKYQYDALTLIADTVYTSHRAAHRLMNIPNFLNHFKLTLQSDSTHINNLTLEILGHLCYTSRATTEAIAAESEFIQAAITSLNTANKYYGCALLQRLLYHNLEHTIDATLAAPNTIRRLKELSQSDDEDTKHHANNCLRRLNQFRPIEIALYENGVTMDQMEQAYPATEWGDSIYCPISQGIYTNPVVLAANGRTYERRFALELMRQDEPKDPITRKPLTASTDRSFRWNYALRNLITTLIAKYAAQLKATHRTSKTKAAALNSSSNSTGGSLFCPAKRSRNQPEPSATSSATSMNSTSTSQHTTAEPARGAATPLGSPSHS